MGKLFSLALVCTIWLAFTGRAAADNFRQVFENLMFYAGTLLWRSLFSL